MTLSVMTDAAPVAGTEAPPSTSNLRTTARILSSAARTAAGAVAGTSVVALSAPSSTTNAGRAGKTFKGIFQTELDEAWLVLDKNQSGNRPAPSKTGADFRQRLEMLLSDESHAKAVAAKLYPRFEGDTEKLNNVERLLEERWGFPDRVFALLWTHLRRVAGQAEMPARVDEEQWGEAFLKWLHALQARTGRTKVSRQCLIQRRTAADMERAYLQGAQLGQGSYGEVRLTLHKTLGVARVVKVVPKVQLDMPEEHVQEEVNLLRSMDHPHIVRIFETFETEDKLFMVMDYAEGGDLSSVIKKMEEGSESLQEDWIRAASGQVVQALQYMHHRGVIHCDLKPANVMLLCPYAADNTPHCLLADFGVSEIFEKRNDGAPMKMKGTPVYLSPEGFEGQLSCKSDMWAVGVIIYELFIGERPFKVKNGSNLFVLWNQIMHHVPELDQLPPPVQDIVGVLLQKEHKDRPTAAECYSKPWFSQDDKPALTPTLAPERTTLGHASYFHRSAMFWVAAGLSIKDMRGVLSTFQFLDINQSGNLSLENLEGRLAEVGVQQDPKTVLSLLDLDQNGLISYTEFLAGALRTSEDLTERLLQYAFECFDLDNDGFISMAELRSKLSGDGPLVDILPDGQTVEQVMNEASNGEGRVSMADFRAYMKKAKTEVVPAAAGDKSHMTGVLSDKQPTSIQEHLEELDDFQEDPVRSASKPSHPAAFPPFHAWLIKLSSDTLQDAAFTRSVIGGRFFLLFEDWNTECTYVSHSLPHTCQQTAILALIFFVYCIWCLLTEDFTWSPMIAKWDQGARVAHNIAFMILALSCMVIMIQCFLWIRAATNASSGWLEGLRDETAIHFEYFLCCWGCVIPWISCLFANRYRVASLFGDEPVEVFGSLNSDYDLILTMLGTLAFFAMRTHLRFMTMLHIATSCFLAYAVSSAALGIADPRCNGYNSQRGIWPAMLLLLLSGLILSGQRAIEYERRLTHLSLFATYKSLWEMQQDDPNITALISGEEKPGIKTGGTKSARFSRAIDLIKRLSEATEVSSRPLRVALQSLLEILSGVRQDVLQSDLLLAVDVGDLLEDRNLAGHAKEVLLPLFDKPAMPSSHKKNSNFSASGKHIGLQEHAPELKDVKVEGAEQEVWGSNSWDTLSEGGRPLMSAGDLLTSVAQALSADASVSVLQFLEALLQVYEMCPARAEARALMAIRSSHWMACRIGLWAELEAWERMSMLVAAAGLHCAGDGGFFSKDPMLIRVACAGRLLEVLDWSGLAESAHAKEMRKLVCTIVVRARPRCMLDDARQVRLRFDRDDEMPVAETEERAALIGLVVSAADYSAFALPASLSQPWTDFCQADAAVNPLLRKWFSKDKDLNIASWLWGLVELLLDPVFETLEVASGPAKLLEEPRRNLQDNVARWKVTPLLVNPNMEQPEQPRPMTADSDDDWFTGQAVMDDDMGLGLPGQVDQVD